MAGETRTQIKDRVRIDDRGFKVLARRLGQINRARVSVGIFEDAPPVEEGFTMASLAAVHEFGSRDGRIPERSFLQSTADVNADEYQQEFERYTDRVVLEGRTASGELFKFGQRVRRDIINRIRTGEITPALEQSTIDRKGSSTPLIDTGALLGSINARVTKK